MLCRNIKHKECSSYVYIRQSRHQHKKYQRLGGTFHNTEERSQFIKNITTPNVCAPIKNFQIHEAKTDGTEKQIEIFTITFGYFNTYFNNYEGVNRKSYWIEKRIEKT